MRYIIILLFLGGNIFAQSPIEDFDKVMEAYNNEYTSTDDAKEQEQINKKYDILIAQAEKKFEAEMEKQIQRDREQLEKEQADTLVIIDDIEEEEEEEEEEGDNENNGNGGDGNDQDSEDPKAELTQREQVVNMILALSEVEKNEITGQAISELFYTKSRRKNGYSLVDIAKIFQLPTSGKKIIIANRIAKAIRL